MSLTYLKILTILRYTTTHFSGKDAVGSYIKANKDGFLKDKYRKFNIRSSNTQDDYSMMQEVLTRRIKHGDLLIF